MDLATVTCRVASSSAGNAAGTGARIALLNGSSRGLIQERVRQVIKVETSTESDFQQYFVEAMVIPHATQPYKRLAKYVRLPKSVGAPARKRRKN